MNETIVMNEINQKIVEIYIAQAMLTFALEVNNNSNTTTDKIAKEYAKKIMEELK